MDHVASEQFGELFWKKTFVFPDPLREREPKWS